MYVTVIYVQMYVLQIFFCPEAYKYLALRGHISVKTAQRDCQKNMKWHFRRFHPYSWALNLRE